MSPLSSWYRYFGKCVTFIWFTAIRRLPVSTIIRHVAVGFLYHADSGKVLLHLRDADKPPNPGKWAFFGGRSEPEDGDSLLATWHREMREELGITLDRARIVSLRHGAYADGTRWHDFYYVWPSLAQNFVLTEGQRYAWFTFDEAFSLPDLADYAREDLHFFHQRLMHDSRDGAE